MDAYLFLEGDAVRAAQKLLGCLLVREIAGRRIVGRIVETEAYHQSDAASHSYRGKTPRVEVMFGPAGFAYVYFTYGMHYCMNVVTGRDGEGSAVLIRAVEPIEGLDLMRANRGKTSDMQLTNGPAKLCQALQINKEFNGHNLRQLPLKVEVAEPLSGSKIVASERIGITKDTHRLWRFYIKDSPHVSRPPSTPR